jgi:hypothetical protein
MIEIGPTELLEFILDSDGFYFERILETLLIYKSHEIYSFRNHYGPGQGQLAGTFERGNEPSFSIKCGEFLD